MSFHPFLIVDIGELLIELVSCRGSRIFSFTKGVTLFMVWVLFSWFYCCVAGFSVPFSYGDAETSIIFGIYPEGDGGLVVPHSASLVWSSLVGFVPCF